MAYAEKRDGKLTGRWYGEVIYKERNVAPVRYRRAFDTKRAAEGYEAYVKATGIEPPDLDGAKLTGLTFAQAAEKARAASDVWKRGRDPSGQKRLDYIIARIGQLPLEQVTTEELDKIVALLSARPAKSGGGKLSAGTINRYLTFASAVLTFSEERGLLKKGPVIPWLHEDGHRIHWLTEEQETTVVRWLIEQGHLTTANIVRVLCASGLRWGEFEGLEVYQVTMGAEVAWIKLDKTKTDSPRDVPIDPELAALLRAILSANSPRDYRTIRSQFGDAIKACGYAPQLTLHCCRHTTATRLIKKKTPLPIVQQFMGHKSIQTTLKYVHVESDDLAEAAKNLYPQRGKSTESEAIPGVVAFKKA